MLTPSISTGASKRCASPQGVSSISGRVVLVGGVAEDRTRFAFTGCHKHRGRSGKRQLCGHRGIVTQPSDQPAYRRCCRKVAGGMIERLHRERHRPIGLLPTHACFGDTARHLYEAVEPSAGRPWPGPSIGAQRHVDQARIDRPAPRLSIIEPIKGAGAITVDQYVGFRQQPLEHPSVVGFVKIELRASLAKRHVRGDYRLVPVGRIDPEDIGPEFLPGSGWPPGRPARG